MYLMRNFPLCHYLYIFFVWQFARVYGNGIIFFVVWKRHSSRPEIGFGVLVMVTMKITIKVLFIHQLMH